MPFDKELGGNDIELFGDVLTDLDQMGTTLAALTGIGFMDMGFTRQMIGQRLPTGLTAGFRRGICRG